jgi:hypothetical protein
MPSMRGIIIVLLHGTTSGIVTWYSMHTLTNSKYEDCSHCTRTTIIINLACNCWILSMLSHDKGINNVYYL